MTHAHRHHWVQPHAVVGGDERNPGTWSSGATHITLECCDRCGKYRREEAPYGAHMRSHRQVTYLPADAKSIAHAAGRRRAA